MNPENNKMNDIDKSLKNSEDYIYGREEKMQLYESLNLQQIEKS